MYTHARKIILEQYAAASQIDTD